MQIIIDHIIYVNEVNHYYVASARLLDDALLPEIVVTGYCMDLIEGSKYEVELNQKMHSKYGVQYEITSCQSIAPKDEESIISYLSSGNFSGIKYATARDIVNLFGKDTLDIMKHSPERLLEVRGIGKKKLDGIIKSYQSIEQSQEVLFYLSSLGLTLSQSNKIYEKYKHATKKSLEKNPYLVMRSVPGIGFKTAEMVAEKLGFDRFSTERIQALIVYRLEEFSANGHMFAFYEELISEFKREGMQEELFQNALLHLIYEDVIYVDLREDNFKTKEEKSNSFEENFNSFEEKSNSFEENNKFFEQNFNSLEEDSKSFLKDADITSRELRLSSKSKVYLKNMFLCEIGIISELIRILTADCEDLSFDQNYSSIPLSDEQLEALNCAFQDNIFILTGGPGTGKTTILKELVYRIKSVGLEFVLAAPTGRAASRLEEVIGESASTIHRLLEYNYVEDMGFLIYNKNRENPIEADVIIIDEVSMIDAMLFHKLLCAIASGSRLILIGDYNQLPSVSAGNVLEDLINSGLINTYKLNKVHRQAQNSLIIKNAHEILSDGSIEYNVKDGDFYFLQSHQVSEVLQQVISLVSTRLPNYYGIDPVEDICVLTPGKKGILGSFHLNEKLQEVLNQNKGKKFNQRFLVGDKVMQNRNNYELDWFNTETGEVGVGVFNGEIGIVENFDEESLLVNFGNSKYVAYTLKNSEDLVLAYAMTIHKSQGNEFDYCVIPILNTPALLKYRKLIYTGITRAKKQVTLVGSFAEFKEMIANANDASRNTGLYSQIKTYLDNAIGQMTD